MDSPVCVLYTPKWRWGPVENPSLPMSAMYSPASTS